MKVLITGDPEKPPRRAHVVSQPGHEGLVEKYPIVVFDQTDENPSGRAKHRLFES